MKELFCWMLKAIWISFLPPPQKKRLKPKEHKDQRGKKMIQSYNSPKKKRVQVLIRFCRLFNGFLQVCSLLNTFPKTVLQPIRIHPHMSQTCTPTTPKHRPTILPKPPQILTITSPKNQNTEVFIGELCKDSYMLKC